MRIVFNELEEKVFPGMNDGTGTMSAKMYMDKNGKVIMSRIHPGGSIGMHLHQTSDDINYVISGTGIAYCDDVKEELTAGVCHICPKGHRHQLINTGMEDLVLLTVVVER
jgi:mannose-6-phosphate isomerase-like protein (cupin superfamily)